MTHVLRIAHLRIALHVANLEVGKREGIRGEQSRVLGVKHGMARNLVFCRRNRYSILIGLLKKAAGAAFFA